MTDLIAAGQLLAADMNQRELTYLILPFGEPGRTNLGTLTASAGTLTLPDDPSRVTLNEEHDFTRPLGRATAIIEDQAGITATFKVAATSRGDDILIEASEGLRTGASVEISRPVIRDGALVAGELDAVASVVRPAFPSAQLQMVAADCGELPNTQEETMANEATAATTDVAPETVEVSVQEPQLAAADTTPNPAMLAAQAPAGMHAPQPTRPGVVGPTVCEALNMFATALNPLAPQDAQLHAALTNITQANILDEATQPQWIGELYEGRGYVRKYAPLVNARPLTGLTIEGYDWVAEPDVDDWTPGSDIDSGAVSVTKVSETAARIAGGNSVDRAYTDFSVPGFWESYFRRSFRNYDRKLDAKVPTFLKSIAGSTPGTADVVGAAPTDVALATHLIVEGAMSIIDDYAPTFALIHPDTYKAWLKTRQQDDMAYINAALGLQGGTTLGLQVVPWSGIQTDECIVGDKFAATLFELPGVPVRVDAVNITKGQTEHGVYGYYALLEEDAAGLAYVSVTNA